MSDEKDENKIAKLAEKKKTKAIMKIMEKANSTVVIDALGALAQISDEDAINCIASYLDSTDDLVKVAAAKAAMSIDSEYLKTQVRRVCNSEKDENLHKQLLATLNT